MTGVILAGGRSSRIGTKKAFLQVGKYTIIDDILAVYKRIFSEIIIVANSPEDFTYTGAKIVKDIFQGTGSIGGLYTGIKEASSQYCFVTACDMPLICESLINYLISIKTYDAVVPVIKEKYHPLFALYSKSCLNSIRIQIEKGNLKIRDSLMLLNLKKVQEEELRKYDCELLSFINVNTPQDYEDVICLVKSMS